MRELSWVLSPLDPFPLRPRHRIHRRNYTNSWRTQSSGITFFVLIYEAERREKISTDEAMDFFPVCFCLTVSSQEHARVLSFWWGKSIESKGFFVLDLPFNEWGRGCAEKSGLSLSPNWNLSYAEFCLRHYAMSAEETNGVVIITCIAPRLYCLFNFVTRRGRDESLIYRLDEKILQLLSSKNRSVKLIFPYNAEIEIRDKTFVINGNFNTVLWSAIHFGPKFKVIIKFSPVKFI